jgi:hypothetical protein
LVTSVVEEGLVGGVDQERRQIADHPARLSRWPTAHLRTLDDHSLSSRRTERATVPAPGQSGVQGLGRHHAKFGALAAGTSRCRGRHRVRRCAQGEHTGPAISASRKTCRTCFPRCRLRSDLQTDPVTDDRSYAAPSTAPHHAHTGTDLCPSHGSPYCQYAVTAKPADRHPRRPHSDRPTNREPGYPALPRHP